MSISRLSRLSTGKTVSHHKVTSCSYHKLRQHNRLLIGGRKPERHVSEGPKRHKTLMLCWPFNPLHLEAAVASLLACQTESHVFILKVPTLLNISSGAPQGWVLGLIMFIWKTFFTTATHSLHLPLKPWIHAFIPCHLDYRNSTFPRHGSQTLQQTPFHPKSCSTLPHSQLLLWPHHPCATESNTGPLTHNVSISNSSDSPIKPERNQTPPYLTDLHLPRLTQLSTHHSQNQT